MEKTNEEFIFLPVSVNITGKKLLIIGGGKVGFHKATILSRFTQEATVIAPEFHEGFTALPFGRVKKEYEKTDLDGAFLVYVCTENRQLNAKIKQDAEALGILASVCDDPAACDFISPAIYKNGDVTIAVSSNARNVRRSVGIRNRISDLVREGTIII
ncbi:MAG: bifunctional precorrin-2 dehydrogenase/sirohydrochlorin ferrochelatase [Tannerella sp.]|jgi:siroheme synthase-like protein|nr:bifunctional precorrin-2 dehydrogenase/sirohydrochlorin ferrochelatase [Tannerella sp.]